MTEPAVLDRLRAIVERTRFEQGLPPQVVDNLVLGQVADVVRLADRQVA